MSTHRIRSLRWGELSVTTEQRDGGWYARLTEPHDRLRAVRGAVGATQDEALDNLIRGLERFGSDPPAPPRWPQHPA